MIKLAYNKSKPNLVFEVEEICRVPINGGIVEYYKGVLTDTSTVPDTHTENYMVQVMAFESDWSEVPTDVGGTSNVNNTSITVNPETSKKTYGTPSGYTGINNVTVNAVTSAIDSNIAAGNIKDGVTILGVAGTYVKPDEPNLVAENIKKDVTIYDVTGSYEGEVQEDNLLVLNSVTATLAATSASIIAFLESFGRVFYTDILSQYLSANTLTNIANLPIMLKDSNNTILHGHFYYPIDEPGITYLIDVADMSFSIVSTYDDATDTWTMVVTDVTTPEE